MLFIKSSVSNAHELQEIETLKSITKCAAKQRRNNGAK